MKFCGAVARALLIGVYKTCYEAVLPESKRREIFFNYGLHTKMMAVDGGGEYIVKYTFNHKGRPSR
jgi:hypothetical protein